MRLDGARPNVQGFGDCGVGAASGHQLEDLAFAFTEVGERVAGSQTAHDAANDVSSAAPVGVHASAGIELPSAGAPASASRASTAGTGTGSTPCAVRTEPLPTATGDEVARVMPRYSIAARE